MLESENCRLFSQYLVSITGKVKTGESGRRGEREEGEKGVGEKEVEMEKVEGRVEIECGRKR